jgi:hypothetical protein
LDDVISNKDRDLEPERGRDRSQESQESKTQEQLIKLSKGIRSRSPSPVDSISMYQEVDMVGLSPNVDMFCDPDADSGKW